MEGILDLTRFTLAQNVYPFHSLRLRAAARPALGAGEGEEAEDEGRAGPSKRGKKAKAVAAAGMRCARAPAAVQREDSMNVVSSSLLPALRRGRAAG